jgi:hypothetical protein
MTVNALMAPSPPQAQFLRISVSQVVSPSPKFGLSRVGQSSVMVGLGSVHRRTTGNATE